CGGRTAVAGLIGITFCAGAVGGVCGTCSAPLSVIGAGSIAGTRVFQRTFGFKVGEIAVLLIGVTGIRRSGTLARRSAGFGTGTGAWVRTGSGFFRTAAGAGAGCGFGLGSA